MSNKRKQQELSWQKTTKSAVVCRIPSCAQASVKGIDMQLMTSHLESTAEHGKERVRQLRACMKQVQDAPKERTVVFGGDLNLRDKEVSGPKLHCFFSWHSCTQ